MAELCTLLLVPQDVPDAVIPVSNQALPLLNALYELTKDGNSAEKRKTLEVPVDFYVLRKIVTFCEKVVHPQHGLAAAKTSIQVRLWSRIRVLAFSHI